MTALIIFTVIFVIGAFIWIRYFISKEGEIIDKNEQAKSAIADLNATREKSNKALKEEVEAVRLYLQHHRQTLEESRQLVRKELQNPELDPEQSLQQLFEVYPKDTGEEVFEKLLTLIDKEREDVQQQKERANAYIADYNTVVKGPISRFVARAMRNQNSKLLHDESQETPVMEKLQTMEQELLAEAQDEETNPELEQPSDSSESEEDPNGQTE